MTSSSSSSQSQTYDVFLSFKGEDTRKTFVDHLYHALIDRGLSIYKDDEALVRGKSIGPALFKAIEESRIALIVFSENLASSSWCLDEVAYIMRCREARGLTVIPVFYGVYPSEVRKQTGKYEIAFAKHELENKDKVESWRKALSDAAHISGFDRVTGDVPMSVIQIRDYILQKLDPVHDLRSSSSQPIPASFSHSWTYDVFISNTGKDSTNTFVDHLYTALGQQNVNVYRDDIRLRWCESYRSTLWDAIAGSKIAVIIFSKDYARLSWCLDELVYIMKCVEERGQTVLPIFDDVEPSEVRHQKRKYGEAFEKHMFENNSNVESWRKTLSDAARISGWSFNQNGNELGYTEEIVGTISQILHPVLSFTHGLSSSPSSCSVAASYSQWRNHDVFLSFIGEHDSKIFVDHLYSTLIQQGIHTYKSDGILTTHNDLISPSPLNAIEESQIAIIIFNKNYARSSRCLDDLSYIMTCIDMRGMHVMPIFYDVSSSDVQEQNGEFGKEFYKQELENRAKVESWRKALKGACNHPGWSLKHIANRHEGRYIKEIVNAVSHLLLSLISKVKKDLIGIEPRLKDLTSKLAIGSDDVCIVVVVGVGGSGKTTIASCVYMEIARQFEGRCFVENIREESSKHGLKGLQQKILSTILKKEVAIPSDEEGRCMIQTMLCNKKVLIVLDDIVDIEQMELLVGSRNSFGNGSRIIITSRDERFPLNKVDSLYSVNLLTREEAIQLFARHAYHGHKPVDKGKWRPSSSSVEAYRIFSQDVISHANGLPLALKILGSFLYGKEKDTWKSALVKVKDTPKLGIMNTLKLSYEGLQNVEKELFKDIACFFKGKLVDSSMMLLLEAFHVDPVIKVNELVQKSLITISNGMFGIHDLVEEIAHHIVRREHPKHPEEHSRVWRSSDVADVCAVETTKIIYKIQAIYAPDYDAPPNLLKVVANMISLRLLNVRQHVKEVIEEPLFLSDELRWISWENYPASSIPTSFQPKMLLSLILRNGLQKVLWQDYKYLPRLKVLDLHGSKNLITTPDFDGLPNLERLILSSCSSLEDIHPSIGYHENLVYLNLDGCEKLETFPPIFRMPKLETLILSRCFQLLKFPEIQGTMNGLQHFYLDNTGIEDLPSSVSQYCINLAFINLIGCDHLKSIEGNFQLLKGRCLILVD